MLSSQCTPDARGRKQRRGSPTGSANGYTPNYHKDKEEAIKQKVLQGIIKARKLWRKIGFMKMKHSAIQTYNERHFILFRELETEWRKIPFVNFNIHKANRDSVHFLILQFILYCTEEGYRENKS